MNLTAEEKTKYRNKVESGQILTDEQYRRVSTMGREAKRRFWRKNFNHMNYNEFTQLVALKKLQIDSRPKPEPEVKKCRKTGEIL